MLHIVNKSSLERNTLESCLRVANGGAQNSRGDMDLLDIPAFLRRQAD